MIHTVARKKRKARARLLPFRLDVRTGGGPFIAESFHFEWDAAYERGLSIFGIEDGDPLPDGDDFIVREPVEG